MSTLCFDSAEGAVAADIEGNGVVLPFHRLFRRVGATQSECGRLLV